MHTSSTCARLRLGSTLALILAAMLVFSPAAFGQEGEAEKEKSVTEQIQELAEDLTTREKDLKELRVKIEKVKGTAAAGILQTELVDRRARFRRGAEKLVALVLSGEDGGADVAQARALVTRLLEEDATRIRKERSELGARLLALADTMQKGSPEEAAKARMEHDGSIPTSDKLLKQLDANIDQRRELGINVDADVKLITKALKIRSKVVAGALHKSKEDIDRIAAQPGIQEDPEAQKELAALKKERDILAESQRVNVALMDEYGLETAELRQGIISATGKISEDILDKQVVSGLIDEWSANAADWLKTNGLALLFRVAISLLILLAFWFIAKLGRGMVRRAFNRSKLDVSSLAKEFFIKSTGRLIILLGVIVAIAQLGVEVAPLLAGLGIAGFVVGFALQDTLGNFASGMMILVYRPFDVGDVVEAGGVMGKVHQMNLVSTMVLTFDNQLLVVPNSKIWGDVIRNVTHQDERRVDLVFGIGYSDDIPHAERVLKEIVEKHDKVLEDPEAVIRLHELGDSSVNFIVRPWAKTDDYWDVYWDITREVKRRFDEEGISIPFPQRDVHFYREDGEANTGSSDEDA